MNTWSENSKDVIKTWDTTNTWNIAVFEEDSEVTASLRESFTDSKVIAALIGAISLITTTILTVIYGKKK